MSTQYSAKTGARPYLEKARGTDDATVDYWGAFSLETFCDWPALSQTHEDAQGWLTYLQQFQPPNFWYQDGYVRPWAYYEEFDNWDDTYGTDAVLAMYHSGHGQMVSDGTFHLPLGADWGGLGCTAFSSQMRLGNEQANYIYWSTCESLRIYNGHSPYRTWAAANLGFRMMFGYETLSIDSPSYGSFYWEGWNSGQSLSTAWLEASWRIAHNQAPVVVACGETVEEAQNRLWNERMLEWGHVSTNWWWWRWYDAVTDRGAIRSANLALPETFAIAVLTPRELNNDLVEAANQRFGLRLSLSDCLERAAQEGFVVEQGGTRLSIAANGDLHISFAQPNLANRTPLETERAIDLARETIGRFGFDRDVELVFDQVRLEYEAGQSRDDREKREGPFLTGTSVQFKQVINGLPVTTPGTGQVMISLDNDGAVTDIRSSLREVAYLSERPRKNTGAPNEGVPSYPLATDEAGYERLLDRAWAKQSEIWASGPKPVGYATVPDSTEVGYEIDGNNAYIAARRQIEVDFGGGYKKRYWVTAPIFE
ncbi:DUF6345 domain-containing protein [soil metagenome]